MSRVESIEKRLREALSPAHVAVEDDSGRHVGHAGSAGGGGHFNLVIVSDQFAGASRLARQRAVYAALDELIPDEIHALSIRAYSPPEWAARHAPPQDREP